jgi:hypothetical protein
MAKKKMKKRPNKPANRTKQTVAAAKKRFNYPMFAILAGAVLAITGGYFFYQGKKPPAPAPSMQLTGGKTENISLRETRPTLSPSKFAGKVRSAYAVARAIPQVLDRLYCYCRCRENFNHKNLLSCFVDTHAST